MIDLDKTRQAREALVEAVQQAPTDRTGRFLRGELEGKESPMGDKVSSLRIPQSHLDRADELRAPMGEDVNVSAYTGNVTRSVVIRAAIHEGLKVLERRYRRPQEG